MLPSQTHSRLRRVFASMGTLNQFMLTYRNWLVDAGDDACDFAVGSPHEMPLPGFVNALEKAVHPQNKDWYAYTRNAPSATETVVQALQQQFKRSFEPEDIFMTNGATGAIDIVLNALIDFGDEAIFISPPWFFYEGMIQNVGGFPVQVKIDPETFELNLNALEAAITQKTRLVIVNSPHNPTGKIYSPKTLQGLADILMQASKRFGQIIYLLSDEAYRHILFDGNAFYSPTNYYPHSFMVYTYGKTLLTPGQRLGYVAISPEMTERIEMRAALTISQIASGMATTNALLQHALPSIQPLSIDIEHLQEKRDRLVEALGTSGYKVYVPEGTFYLLVHSPLADDMAFANELAAEGVFCLPGKVVEMPGYFRLSLTANDEMIERAIPRFTQVRQRVAMQ